MCLVSEVRGKWTDISQKTLAPVWCWTGIGDYSEQLTKRGKSLTTMSLKPRDLCWTLA